MSSTRASGRVELLGEYHPQQGLDVGGAGEDGAVAGVAVQVQQQPALLEGRRSEIQFRQVGKHPAHHLPGAADALLLKLGVIVIPQPSFLTGGQPQMVDQSVQGGIG